MVRQGNAAPFRPSWAARSRAAGRVSPAPAQGLGDGAGLGVGEQGQDEGLGVPEGVPVVAGPGQSLGGNGPLLRAGACLEYVEEGEADGLLDLLVAVDLDVGAGPEVVEVAALFVQESLPAAVGRGRQGRVDLVAHRGPGAGPGPAVGDQLLQPQPLSRLQDGGDGQPGQVHRLLAAAGGALGSFDDVVGGHGDPQSAVPGAVHQPQTGAVGEALLVLQRRLQGLGGARVAVRPGQALVADEFGLDDHASAAVDGLHLVGHGGDRPLGERDEPGRAHPYPRSRR